MSSMGSVRLELSGHYVGVPGDISKMGLPDGYNPAAPNTAEDGFFGYGTRDGLAGAALALVCTPGAGQWWGYVQHFIGDEVVQHINDRLEAGDEIAPDFLYILPTFRKRPAELKAEAG